MEEGVVHGYHLLLVPEERLADQLERVIDALARTHGGPRFVAHLTIAAQIIAPEESIRACAKQLAERAAPRVVFSGIVAGSTFFTCVYLSTEPSAELVELNRRARETFDITNTFAPHVSLAYGSFTPSERAALAREAEQLLGDVPAAAFPYLELWHTEGAAEAWERTARYPFASAN